MSDEEAAVLAAKDTLYSSHLRTAEAESFITASLEIGRAHV